MDAIKSGLLWASMVGEEWNQSVIGLYQIDVVKGIEAGLSIMFVAIIIDRLTQAISNQAGEQV